jgi:hypothetical protein
MTKDYDKIKKQLKEYYQDLLIMQYHDKPKAREVVKANIEEELCNLLEQKVKDAFDVDTAIGVQLDIIGKWVGIERIFKGQKYDNQAWFSLPRYNQKTNSFMHGFSTYATFEEEGGYLTYDFILGTKNKLNDNDFRMLIKLKIIRNNIPHSPKPIDDAMYKLFADTLYTVWNEMVYNSDAFTVVGSPTITSDGVASGFSNAFASYVSANGLNAKDLKDKSWKIKASVIVPNGFWKIVPIFNIGKVYGMFGTVIVGQGYVRFASRTGTMRDTNNEGGKITINKQANVTHIAVELEYNLNTGTYKLIAYDFLNNIKLGEGSWTAPIEGRTNTQLVGINEGGEIVLGAVRDGNEYYEITHTIDLKQFSITVDGKEVLNGGYSQPMEMTFYYNPKRYGIVKLGQEKNCFPIPTGVKANFVEVKR